MGANDAAGLAIIWISFTLALIFLLLRLYVRWYRQKTVSVSDGLVVFAVCLFLYISAANTANYHMGQWDISLADPQAISLAMKKIPDRKKLRHILRILWTAGPCFYWAMWSIKAAVILFYHNLITPAFTTLRIMLNITTGLCVITFIISEGLSLFWCWPISRNWALDDTFCTSYSAPPAYYFSVASHLLTDLLIYILPFFVIPLLHMSTRKKIGVFIIFALGSLCLVASIVRVIIVGTAFSQWSVNSLSCIELSTAIMVACSPPLKWLYLKRREEHSSRSRSVGGTVSNAKRTVGGGGGVYVGSRGGGGDYAEPDEPEWGTYSLAAMGVGRKEMYGHGHKRMGSFPFGLKGAKKERIKDDDDDGRSENSISLQTLVTVNGNRVGGEGVVKAAAAPR